MRRLSLLILVLVSDLLTPSIPKALAREMTMTSPVQIHLSKFEVYWDNFFAEKMATRHIPEAVFVVVQDGEILLTKGYGVSNTA